MTDQFEPEPQAVELPQAPSVDMYDDERESVVELVDRYGDLVFDDDKPVIEIDRRNHHVLAIMVTHEGSRWLPPAIATIDRLERAPDLIVAVDTGSTDGSHDLVTEWLGHQHVLLAAPDLGFGAAVNAAIAHADEIAPFDAVNFEREKRAAEAARHGNPYYFETADDGADDVTDETREVTSPNVEPAIQWVWILHDDCAPDPAALQQLLDASDAATTAAVLGPKVLGWHDRRLLLETGVTISGSGRRYTGLEKGEHDQGQHDGVRDVLSVGSAGMLVRRDVYDAVGGFDPNLSMFRDDLDLCWRINEAGYRVLVVTDAVVHHAEAGIHGRRSLAAVDSAARADRESAMHVLLSHSSAVSTPFIFLRLAIGSIVRGLGLLLAKAPEEAAAEFSALGSLVTHPGRIAASRRRVSSTRELSQRDLASLRPRLSTQARHGAESLVGWVAGTAATDVQSTSVATAGPSEDEAFDADFDESGGRWSVLVRRPALLLTVLLALISLLSVRTWFGSGLLQGGALLPAPPGFGDLWSTYAQGWHEVASGSAAAAPPYLMVLAAVSTFFLGNAPRAVDVVLMLAIPLAGIVMYLSLRRVVDSQLVRVIAAAAYALLPASIAAVSTGRLGTAVFLVLLPALIRAALRVPVSWRAAWGAALLLAVITAFVPVIWPVSLVLSVIAIVWARGVPALADDGVDPAGLVDPTWDEIRHPRHHLTDPESASHALALVPVQFKRRDVLLRFGAFILAPLVLLMPWSLDLLIHPSRWLLQAGLPGPVDPDLAPWQVALLNPGGPGTVPVWLTIGLLALAAGGLVRSVSRPLASVALLFAVVGLAIGIVQTLVQVRPPSETQTVYTWPGPATVVIGLGLIVAGAAAADGLTGRLSGNSFSWRQPAAVAAVVAAVAAPVLCASWFVWQGVGSTVQRSDGTVVPAFVAAETQGPDRPRSLVFTPSSRGIEYALINGEGPRIGDAETGPPSEAFDQLSSLVADLMAGRGGGEIDGLGRYGVRFVVLAHPDEELTSVLDSEPGLRRISSAEGDTLWRLDADSSRVRVAGPNPPVVALAAGSFDGATHVEGNLPPKTPSPAALLLAERIDPSWHATLDGNDLAPVADAELQWRQSFTLTSNKGLLRVWFDQEPRHRWLWFEGLVLAALILLALPGRRRDVEDPDADVVGVDEDSIVLEPEPAYPSGHVRAVKPHPYENLPRGDETYGDIYSDEDQT